jgi:hypothetical protein
MPVTSKHAAAFVGALVDADDFRIIFQRLDVGQGHRLTEQASERLLVIKIYALAGDDENLMFAKQAAKMGARVRAMRLGQVQTGQAGRDETVSFSTCHDMFRSLIRCSPEPGER